MDSPYETVGEWELIGRSGAIEISIALSRSCDRAITTEFWIVGMMKYHAVFLRRAEAVAAAEKLLGALRERHNPTP